MSKIIEKEIKCLNCKKDISVILWSTVNVTLNKNLKKLILEESLFEVKCSHCNYQSKILYPFLYHNMNKHFMIYFMPSIIKDNKKEKLLRNDFLKFRETNKRLVFDMNSLKEKILIFEQGFSDKTINLLKLALTETISKNNNISVSEPYFYGYDKNNNKLEFIFLKNQHKEYFHCKIEKNIYNEITPIIDILDINKKEENDFLLIDMDWAKKALNSYLNLNVVFK